MWNNLVTMSSRWWYYGNIKKLIFPWNELHVGCRVVFKRCKSIFSSMRCEKDVVLFIRDERTRFVASASGASCLCYKRPHLLRQSFMQTLHMGPFGFSYWVEGSQISWIPEPESDFRIHNFRILKTLHMGPFGFSYWGHWIPDIFWMLSVSNVRKFSE